MHGRGAGCITCFLCCSAVVGHLHTGALTQQHQHQQCTHSMPALAMSVLHHTPFASTFTSGTLNTYIAFGVVWPVLQGPCLVVLWQCCFNARCRGGACCTSLLPSSCCRRPACGGQCVGGYIFLDTGQLWSYVSGHAGWLADWVQGRRKVLQVCCQASIPGRPVCDPVGAPTTHTQLYAFT